MTKIDQNAQMISAPSYRSSFSERPDDQLTQNSPLKTVDARSSQSSPHNDDQELHWAVVIEKIYQHDGTSWRVCGATRQWNNGLRQTAHSAQFDPKKPSRIEVVEPVADFD